MRGGEGDRPTGVVEVRSKLHIPVSSGRDVKVALDLVQLHAPIDPTCIPLGALSQPRRLLELLAADSTARSTSHRAQHIPDMVRLVMMRGGGSSGGSVRRAVKGMHALAVLPLGPAGVVLLQHLARQDEVAGGVLHVDVQVVAVHGDDHVEVDLQRVPDALLDAELVRLVAAVPAPELGEGEQRARQQQDHGPLSAARVPGRVGGFGFGWERGWLAV